jgi:hypothetical protein
MAEPSTPSDTDGARAPSLTEGEVQAEPGKLAGVMSHQDPRRRHDLDEMLGGEPERG